MITGCPHVDPDHASWNLLIKAVQAMWLQVAKQAISPLPQFSFLSPLFFKEKQSPPAPAELSVDVERLP